MKHATRRGGARSVAGGVRRRMGFLLGSLTLLALSLFATGCVSVPAPPMVPEDLLVPEGFYVPEAQEELYGTWIVAETHAAMVYPKVVIHPCGLVELFESTTSTSYSWRNTSVIVQKWRDPGGDIWYKEYVRCNVRGFFAGQAFNLSRLSSDGQILETIVGNVGWPDPTEMDPVANTTYVKYRRLE